MVTDADGNLFVGSSTEASFAAFHVERLHDLLETAQAIETPLHDRQPAAGSPRRPDPNRSRREGPASGSS